MKKPASSLVVSLGKAPSGIFPLLRCKELVGLSGLPVGVVKSNKRHADRALAHTRK